MTPSQIITLDCQRLGVDPRMALDATSKLVKSGIASLMHQNNSVLLLTFINKSDVELHLFTVDTPLTLMKSLAEFINTIRHSEIRRVYGKADNEGILDMLKRLGVNVVPSDKEEYNWMANVQGTM